RLCCALLLAFLLLPLGAGGPAFAAEPRVARIDPVIRDGKLEVDADVDITLNSQLRDAAERGLPLYFTADLVVSRSRWWWFDETVVDTSLTWRVVYNALTRQWRAGAGRSEERRVGKEGRWRGGAYRQDVKSMIVACNC